MANRKYFSLLLIELHVILLLCNTVVSISILSSVLHIKYYDLFETYVCMVYSAVERIKTTKLSNIIYKQFSISNYN